jgi:hypothetical protein
MASVVLSANSTLDFSSGNTLTIQFNAASQTVDGSVLTIANWSGNPDVGGGADRLLVTIPDVAAFQSTFGQNEIAFSGFDPGYALIQQGVTTVYEVVPVATAVPEPASLMVLGLGAVALLRRRPR